MSVQNEFLEFHKRIKLDYNVKSELAEKRDVLLRILNNNDEIPGFKVLNQGSYAMYIGTEPIDGREYDIDVGLRFLIDKADYEPMYLKNKIKDLLKTHTEYGAKIKLPCVTVTYMKNGEAVYHVDLVVYSSENKNIQDSQIYLARGKDSKPDEICWEKSDPKGLVDYINNAIEKKNREQFRRVVRYLKRWKNLKFNSVGHAEPASIGITLIAADYFISFEEDLDATLNLAEEIQKRFFFVGKNEEERCLYRITYPMPNLLNFESTTDAFEKMTDSQMTDFKEKIDKLVRDLKKVKDETDEMEKYKMLQKIFGNDFHVPGVDAVSRKQRDYLPSSSSSGGFHE